MKKAKEILAIDDLYSYYRQIRSRAREASELRTVRKVGANRAASIVVLDNEGNPEAEAELTEKEYAAIRRYLLRNRLRTLREEGADV